MDVVLRRALDRCDCKRCRGLAQQLDALIPTPSHIAAYVAFGVALALTAVFAAGTYDWEWPQMLGVAVLVGTVWFVCLMGAMAWGGGRLTQPDPLAWSGRQEWVGWGWLLGGTFAVWLCAEVVAGAPAWLLVGVPIVLGGYLLVSARRRRRLRRECWRDRTG